jgi:hypothetical protein
MNKLNNSFNKIIEENNLEECLKLKSEYFCKKELSIKHNNIDMCLELPDSSNGDWRYSMRYNCLYKIAINKLDENIRVLPI